jgi:ubiquinone/menaquinone biosynthesis C-methylase UbiE
MDPEKARDVVRNWRDSAPYWERHRDAIRAYLSPISDGMIEAASLRKNQFVLDVAGGAGEPSLAIARLIGPSGRVTCTDIAHEMVAAAGREAWREDLRNVDLAVCAADALSFCDDSFDAVVCRLGAMFFPDPPAAIAEMVRVTRPNGTVTLAVWGSDEANPFFGVATDVVSRYVETPPEPPDAPGAFRFAERGRLAEALTEAGAVEVGERALAFRMEAPIAFDEFWTTRVEMSSSLRTKVGSLGEEEARALREDMRDATRQYFTGGHMCFPAEVLIVTGRRPG